MYVDKEVAKRMIDETPGKIWIDSFNGMTFIHTRPRQITVDEGKRIINRANTINYQNRAFAKRRRHCTLTAKSTSSNLVCPVMRYFQTGFYRRTQELIIVRAKCVVAIVLP